MARRRCALSIMINHKHFEVRESNQIKIACATGTLAITYHIPKLSQPKTCNRSRGPPNPPRGRVETVPYYLPDSLHGDPSKREPGVRCVEVPIHPSGPELRRPRARVERFRSAPVGTGVTEWYRKGSDRRDGGCARFSPHPHGRASTARPLYGGRGAAILPVRPH